MEFFCAKCKKKHDASLIGFNFWEVCAEEAAKNVAIILADEDVEWAESLEKFCRDAEASKKAFIFSGVDIPPMLYDRTVSETVVSGIFTLNLRWLCEKYEERFGKTIELDNTLLDEPVFSRYIKVSYEMVEGQHVLSCIMDERDDPFTNQAGTMLGFVRCCPEGHTLSQSVGKAKEFVIGLAGSPRAGKTTCITAISRALRDGIYQQSFGLSMDVFMGDAQWKKLEEEIAKYRKGHAVEKTPLDNDNLAYSILVRIGNARRVLTFVDMPGEFFAREDGSGFDKRWFTDYEGIYRNLDCIWLFVSKWTAYNITSLSEEKERELHKQTAEKTEQIIYGDAAHLNTKLRRISEAMRESGKKMPPIAVMLTKGDVDFGQADVSRVEKYNLFPVVDGCLASPDSVSGANEEELEKVLGFSREHKRFILDEYEFWERASRVRKFFCDVNAGAFCAAIEDNCPRRTYISMAAYGHPAVNPEGNADGEAIPPTPYHEMYPLLWTFAILGALPVEHPCEWYKENWLKKMVVDSKETVCFAFSEAKLDHMNYELKAARADGGRKGKQILKNFNNDLYQAICDVASNLFLDEKGKERFVVTRFNHKKG